MLSNIIKHIKPNSSLMITGSKMLCAANLRHFTKKKDMMRPYKPPQSIRPDRKASVWTWDPFIDEYSMLHPFQLEMEQHLRDLHNKFGQYFGDNEFPACSTGLNILISTSMIYDISSLISIIALSALFRH